MTNDQILERLAPCGLHCGKCFAFKNGEIRKKSISLLEALGNFDIYAERFVELLEAPVFRKYPEFKEMLEYFTHADCGGCRQENCKLFSDCKVRACSEVKGVDFCFQCSEFPCNDTGFDKHLEDRSVDINCRMREIGVVNYYEEIKNVSRY